MKKGEVIKKWLMFGMTFLFLIAGILAILEEQWFSILIVALGLFSIYLPSIIEKRFKIDIAERLEIVVLLFLYSYFYLGEYLNFFYRFWWWDLFLHGTGLFLIGALSFFIVYFLNKEEKVAIKLSPIFVALFAFCFALSIGALWEIFEFFMDIYFNLNMQRSGLMDTMGDLIIGSFGAFLASLFGLVYLKRNSLGFYKWIKSWVKKL